MNGFFVVILFWSCGGAVRVLPDAKAIGEQNRIHFVWGQKEYIALYKSGAWEVAEDRPFFMDSIQVRKVRTQRKVLLKPRDFVRLNEGIPAEKQNGTKILEQMRFETDTLGKHLFTAGEKTCTRSKKLRYQDSLLVVNNQWGYNKINFRKDSLQLCVARYKEFLGWNFSLPTKEYGIIGYPAVIYGSPAWGDNPKPKGIMPLKDLKSLKVDFDAKLFSSGRYNLAFDLWMTNFSDTPIDNPKMEIMVWEDHHPRSRPNGKKVDVLKTSQAIYDVYMGEVNRRKLKLRWKYVAFVNQNKRRKGTTDLDEILFYLLKNQHLHKNDYLGDIEFGTELVSGKGYVVMHNYTIHLNSPKEQSVKAKQ